VIPNHNQSGVLPPFHPNMSVTAPGAMAPYKSSLIEVISRFGTTLERINILKGFINYRENLKRLGITEGLQWIDGSFVEQVELNLGRPPSDIDVVTYFFRPTILLDDEKWQEFIHLNQDIVNIDFCKRTYSTDAYYVDLSSHPIYLVNQTQYWFGLFSHQRDTYLWKGLIEIKLEEDELPAKELLKSIEDDVSAITN